MNNKELKIIIFSIKIKQKLTIIYTIFKFNYFYLKNERILKITFSTGMLY